MQSVCVTGGQSGRYYHHSALPTIRRHLTTPDNHHRVGEVTTAPVQQQTKGGMSEVNTGAGSTEDATYTDAPVNGKRK